MKVPLKTYWQKFRNSKDGRTVASNMAYLTVLQAVSYLFPLLTMPYLARVLGADGLGKIAFAAAVIMWLQTVTDWGFNYTATREVAKERDNWDKVSQIFSNFNDCDAEVLAMDYAVKQFVLPMINGFGEGLGNRLENLAVILDNNGLNDSLKILQRMITDGSERMNSYQFFA